MTAGLFAFRMQHLPARTLGLERTLHGIHLTLRRRTRNNSLAC
ncbi:hypothetical protein GGD46_000366 [Rhizobium lusitanum]|uniref:Uncharacterized protein n=1 Tax=Rhizobium lusitanum TaxID=293958 RepID=A0A7X0ILF5_9HYPH|nr:hypothetical protein [Rhizobium lusitanum]